MPGGYGGCDDSAFDLSSALDGGADGDLKYTSSPSPRSRLFHFGGTPNVLQRSSIQTDRAFLRPAGKRRAELRGFNYAGAPPKRALSKWGFHILSTEFQQDVLGFGEMKRPSFGCAFVS